MTPDKSRLSAVNTPDARIEIFHIGHLGLAHLHSVPVGLEPVAVAARNNHEVWVVNHLSDSISVVDLSGPVPRVVRTLLVGDEPRDIVFAGPGRKLAFITTAHRGQNSPIDPQLTVPGVGRADVWVFDASDPDQAKGNKRAQTMGGKPVTILTLFTDTPRALAVTPDGRTVYAAGFHTGNQTTTITEGAVCDGGVSAPPCIPPGINGLPFPGELTAPGGLPAPNSNFEGVAAPEVGLIVKYNGNHWVDELDRVWDNMVRFNLPDKDVFAIDAFASPPRGIRSFSTVGTILYNMAVNPISGKVYVSNTDAGNEIRFEGARPEGSDITTVQGRHHLTRITVIDANRVFPRHLNKHIDYSVRPAPAATNDKSLAIPTGMEVSKDGSTLYLAAFGSSKIAVFRTSELEADSFEPNSADHIEVSGGGPSGLVLNESRKQLYVLTRFNNAVAVIDTETKREIRSHALYNPEPEKIVAGRRFLYDARFSSSNGEASCASCHVFGDFDSLAWDLGDPFEPVVPNPGPFTPLGPLGPTGPLPAIFHPMKGPMTTQSLRGLANQGPMHWRGDRTGGNDAPSIQPDSGSYDEQAAFHKFNNAFVSLLGRTAPISTDDMQAFTDFILEVTYPPNPLRALDNSLTPDQQAGKDHFLNFRSALGSTCASCHVLDPSKGFFGTDGNLGFTGQPQLTKTTHLRNMYQKVGMFGMPGVELFDAPDGDPDIGHKGDQVRGFGFLHDGSTDTLMRFNRAAIFLFPDGDRHRRQSEDFFLAFDSDLAPIVGQQVTLDGNNAAVVGGRIDLMMARADAGECEVIAKGAVGGALRGWYRRPDGQFRPDRAGERSLTDVELRQLAQPGVELTYTCVPPGSGLRAGIDRNEDGVLDGDE